MALTKPNVYKVLSGTVGPHGYAAGQVPSGVMKAASESAQRKTDVAITAMKERGASQRSAQSVEVQREAIKSGEKTAAAGRGASIQRLSMELAQQDRQNAQQLRSKEDDRRFMAGENRKTREFEEELIQNSIERSDAVFQRDKKLVAGAEKKQKDYQRRRDMADVYNRTLMIKMTMGMMNTAEMKETAREKNQQEVERIQDTNRQDTQLRDQFQDNISRDLEGLELTPAVVDGLFGKGATRGASLRLFGGDMGPMEQWATTVGPMGIMEAKLTLESVLGKVKQELREELSTRAKLPAHKRDTFAEEQDMMFMSPVQDAVERAIQGLERLNYSQDRNISSMYGYATGVISGTGTGNIISALNEALGEEMTELKSRSLDTLLDNMAGVEPPDYTGEGSEAFIRAGESQYKMIMEILQGF